MPSNHLILCRPLLLPPSIFTSIRIFSNKSVLHIRWPKYWSFSFSISPSNEYSGLISFRFDTQQHSTHPSFRRPKPAAGLETLWKTPPTPAPLWHARLPLTQAPTVHQGELRGDLQDTNQSGWPSGRAQPAGTRAGSPPGNASECPFCPAARPLPLDLRALEKPESPPASQSRSGLAKPRIPQPLPYRGRRRDRETNPLLQATRCYPASLPLKLREPSQLLSAAVLSPQPTTHQSPNCPPVPIPLPLGVLIPYVKWRQDRGGNSSQPITHRFSELLCQ